MKRKNLKAEDVVMKKFRNSIGQTDSSDKPKYDSDKSSGSKDILMTNIEKKKKKKKEKKKIDEPLTPKRPVESISVSKNKDSEVQKKKKKTKNKKRKDIESTKEPQDVTSSQKLMSEYLQKWQHDRKNWSFQKVRQVWLLKNLYECEKVKDCDFPVALEYLAGMKGQARERTMKEAQEILERGVDEEKTSEDTESTKEYDATTIFTKSIKKISPEKCDRAKQLLQILT